MTRSSEQDGTEAAGTGVPGRSGVTRRGVVLPLGLAAGGAALTGGAGVARARIRGDARGARRGERGRRTYVLVHGTHSTGAHLAGIARELQRRGHRAVTVDQPLHGTEAFVPEAYQRQDLRALATEPSPLAELSLDDYARRVEEHVRAAARHGPVVLAGHSMGGASVSRVADRVPQLLDHICYFAAFCPSRAMPSLEDCMSSPEASDAVSPDEQIVGDPERLGVVRLNWRTSAAEDLAVFKEMICADYTDSAFRRVLNLMQTDECARAYAGRAVGRAHTWGRIPRTYLRMGGDRLVPPALQDRMIAEADELTPDNRFQVRDFPRASHLGPADPAPVADALHRVRLQGG